MLLDPATIDWTTADDSTVWYAARDGVAQAKEELHHREARAVMSPAVAAAVSRAQRR